MFLFTLDFKHASRFKRFSQPKVCDLQGEPIKFTFSILNNLL